MYESIPVGASKCLVRIAGTDKQFVLPSMAKQILDACQTVDIMHGHVTRIMTAFGISEERRATVEEAVRELQAKGLLVNVATLLPKARANSNPAPPIASVAFPTAGRVADLSRAVSSYVANFQEYGRRPEIVVMDDSRAAHFRPEYLASLRQCRLNLKLRYAGIREKRSYIDALAKSGIAPDLAGFALLGDFNGADCSIGANRNAILLDTAGETIFTADDDTLCKFARHPGYHDGLQFTSHANPRDMWFFQDRDAVIQKGAWTPCDILSAHERLLGRRLSDILSSSRAGAVNLENACDHALWGLQQPNAKVAVTMSGIAGDSGGYSGRWLLTVTGSTRGRLAESLSAFRTALDSREVIGVVPCDTVAHHWLCMGTTMGLANGDLLPPFFPICRNEDGVFGVLASFTTAFCFGHVPAAVLHNAAPGRKYIPFPEFRVSDLISGLIFAITQSHVRDARPLHSRDTNDLLRLLGREFEFLANLPDRDLFDYVFTTATWGRSEFVRQAERLMKVFPDCPTYWRNEVNSFCQYLLADLTSSDRFIPAEFAGALPRDIAKARVRDLIRITGRLFHAWPDMVDAARELRKKGIRISANIDDSTLSIISG